ncbi:MAG: hypothetical protein LBP64_00060 [Tannerella sp.]|jgi:hypothetical protein|nr:hypothetical protein [Tannerella sp.]
MKDIVFTAKQQRCEIAWLSVCIVASFILNVIAIIIYRTEWKELWTQIVWVLFIGMILYGLSVVVRLIAFGIMRLFGKQSNRRR